MPLTEANTVLTPVRGIEILTSHQYPGQPLKAAVLFFLAPVRIYILFHADLIVCVISSG